jgi:predicted aldo/keto reductase-like oxidoreductase
VDKFRFGKTNMMVTRLGFGGIPIQRLNEADAIAVIKRCLHHGINYLDTANGYSTSEERIGKAVKGQRDKVFLATKSGARNADDLQKHLQLSLTRLDVSHIDLYQFHGVNTNDHLNKILEPGGLLAIVEKAKTQGLVKHIGITCHQIDVAKKAVESDQFETLMFPFNFITSEAATELLPLCRQHDVGFVCMKPLAGGMLDNASLCFKYLFQFKDIVSIPGIEKISEIDEIVKILKESPEMTLADETQMKKMKDELGSHFCHRCDYCQPCTTGIPISTVMTAGSFYKRLPPERFYSPMVGGAMEKAAKCSECGECEKRCPYNLPIRKVLAEQVAWYNDLLSKYQKEAAAK